MQQIWIPHTHTLTRIHTQPFPLYVTVTKIKLGSLFMSLLVEDCVCCRRARSLADRLSPAPAANMQMNQHHYPWSIQMWCNQKISQTREQIIHLEMMNWCIQSTGIPQWSIGTRRRLWRRSASPASSLTRDKYSNQSTRVFAVGWGHHSRLPKSHSGHQLGSKSIPTLNQSTYIISNMYNTD